MRDGMKGNGGIACFLVSSSRAQSRDLYVAAYSACRRSRKNRLGSLVSRYPAVFVLPVCKEDFSASLEMTRREKRLSYIHRLPFCRRVPLRGTLSSAFGALLLQGAAQLAGQNELLIPHPQPLVTSHQKITPVSSLAYRCVSSPQPDASGLLPPGSRSDRSRAGAAWRAGRGSGQRLRIPDPWRPAS